MLTPGQIQYRRACPTCNGRGEVPQTADDGTVTAKECTDCKDGYKYQWISIRDLYKQFAEEFTREVRQAMPNRGRSVLP